MADNIVNITNGTGTQNLVDGAYAVTADIAGYVNTSVLPLTVTVTAGVTVYGLTLAANGTVTIHVTDSGTAQGNPIVGASFVRCDSAGNTYGSSILSDTNGDAVFPYIPFDTESGITFYYKQTASDDEHTFSDTLQSALINSSAFTIEVQNPNAPTRTFNLTDANYQNLPLEGGNGSITLSGT